MEQTFQANFLPRLAQQLLLSGRDEFQVDCLYLPAKAEAQSEGFALILHPDPKQGGNYTNKVVQTLARACNNAGYDAYCPNFRGVGQSQGQHDMGKAEVLDMEFLYNYLREKHPAGKIILGGFSFGSSVVSMLSTSCAYDKLILAAPAVGHYPTEVLRGKTDAHLVLHGTEDEIIPLEAVIAWAKDYDQPFTVLPNSSHFFHHKLIVLENLLNKFLLV